MRMKPLFRGAATRLYDFDYRAQHFRGGPAREQFLNPRELFAAQSTTVHREAFQTDLRQFRPECGAQIVDMIDSGAARSRKRGAT